MCAFRMKMEDKRETKSGKVRKTFILLLSLLNFTLYAQSEAEDRHDEDSDAANAAATQQLGSSSTESGDNASLGQDALALPVIRTVDFGEADASTVSVWLENDSVKPGLLYGLGRSETPVGPFLVEEGGWVRADANGMLHEALTAPKVGPQGFYRVVVR